MPKPAKATNVSLSYDSGSGTWKMGFTGDNMVSPDQFAPIVVPFGWEGKITFTIVNSPANVTFADQDPITVLPFTNWKDKPTAVDPQFSVKSSQTELVVKDLNGHPDHPQKGYDGGHFNYVLHFDNAPPIDPIISNSGCCKPTGWLDYPGLGAGAMLALLVVAARPMLKKHRRHG